MGYYSDDETEKQLKTLERKIKKEYSLAYNEMKLRANEYFDKLEDRYQQEFEAFKAGYYTEQEFNNWYLTQVQRGQGYDKMADDLARRISSANQQASAYINDATPSIYSLNYSYETYQIQMHENVSYHAYDEQTIKNLITDTDNVIEFKTTKVNPQRDYEWNRGRIQSAVTSGILQGKSIDKLADSFMTVMKRNRASAIRNARTSVTSAQNAGRQLGYNQANEMGIKLEKEWIATLDERTRISHGLLDGKRVPYDKRFSNGLMYPADSAGAPAEVYNCRCTMRAVLPKVNDSARMTYNEWEEQRNTIPKNLDLDDFELMAKGYSVEKEVTDEITSVIKEYEDKFGLLYSDVLFERMGYYEDKNTGYKKGTLFQTDVDGMDRVILKVNSDLVGGHTVDELNDIVEHGETILANTLKEAVIHDLGHAKAYKGKTSSEISEMNKYLSKISIEGISDIARSDGAEAVAEIEIKLFRGETLTKEENDLYTMCIDNEGEKPW